MVIWVVGDWLCFSSSAAQGCLQAVQVLCEQKSPINLKDSVCAGRMDTEGSGVQVSSEILKTLVFSTLPFLYNQNVFFFQNGLIC